MALIVHIETATKNCSVSIARSGKIIALEEFNDENYSHSEKLHSFIKNTLIKAGIDFCDLDAVAVSMGPGSYTGLRIGVSAAKGLCFALDIPLISVATLTALGHAISVDKGFKIPMLDARRLEVYSAIFDSDNKLIRPVEAEIISSSSFEHLLAKNTVLFYGDGAEKCMDIITHKNAVFMKSIFPSAKDMVGLAFNKFKKNDFENVAYFEPFYLKDFVATKSKK